MLINCCQVWWIGPNPAICRSAFKETIRRWLSTDLDGLGNCCSSKGTLIFGAIDHFSTYSASLMKLTKAKPPQSFSWAFKKAYGIGHVLWVHFLICAVTIHTHSPFSGTRKTSPSRFSHQAVAQGLLRFITNHFKATIARHTSRRQCWNLTWSTSFSTFLLYHS